MITVGEHKMLMYARFFCVIYSFCAHKFPENPKIQPLGEFVCMEPVYRGVPLEASYAWYHVTYFWKDYF